MKGVIKMNIEYVIIISLLLLGTLFFEVALTINKKYNKLKSDVQSKDREIMHVDETTHKTIIEILHNMCIIYSRALFDNKVLDKYNEEQIYDIIMDKDEMVELKNRITIAVTTDIPAHINDYLIYFMGVNFLKVFIESLIVNEITELVEQKNINNVRNGL